jgi:hypothetical protein
MNLPGAWPVLGWELVENEIPDSIRVECFSGRQLVLLVSWSVRSACICEREVR